MSSPKDEQHIHHVLGGFKARLGSLTSSFPLRPCGSPYSTSNAVGPNALSLLLLPEAYSISHTFSRDQLRACSTLSEKADLDGRPCCACSNHSARLSTRPP